MAEQLVAQQQAPQALQQLSCVPGQDYEVMLTALPNGTQGAKHKFSVLLSPRLKPACDTLLSSYKPMFTDWPKTVGAMKFQVFFESPGGMITLDPEPLWSPASLDSPLWAAIFKDTTYVRRYVFDRGQHTDPNKYQLLALRERNLYRSLIKEDLYQTLAVSYATKRPTQAEFSQQLEKAGILQRAPSLRTPGQVELKVGSPDAVNQLFNLRQRLIQKETEILRPGGALAPGVLQRGLEGVSVALRRNVPLIRDDAHILAVTGLNAKQLNFLEFQAFTHPPIVDKVERKRTALPKVNDWKSIIDFHQILSSLGDYPEILKRLGLRLDFQVEDPRIQNTGVFWIRPKETPPTNHFISPKTQYTLTGGFKVPSGDPNSDIRDGLLAFGKKDSSNLPLFDVVPGDVEGAVAKIANFTALLLQPSQAAQRAHSLPALRSGGLSVAHSQRDSWLENLLHRTAQLNDLLKNAPPLPPERRGTNIVLTAEHLVRGLRIDVREVRQAPGAAPQFGPWRSLCDRRGAYYLGAGLPPVLDHTDEGWIALGLTEGAAPAPTVTSRGTSPLQIIPKAGVLEGALGGIAPAPAPAPAPVTPLLLYESLFRWSGWSLSVPRPGKSMQDPTLIPQAAPVPGLNMTVAFGPVAGTLPRLRFGRQYQFRARVVDLAGNSLSLKDVPNTPADLVTSDKDGYYDRFEPVNSPVVVLTQPVTGPPSTQFPEGDPVSPKESVARLVIRSMNIESAGEPLAGPPTPVTSRHIVPPKISQDLAEAHGMFDNPQSKMVGGTEAYRLMIAKDGRLSEQETKEDVHPEPGIVVPYLPDPMAAGATFFNLPGTERNAFLWPQVFEGDWPNRKSFRIQVEGGTGSPQYQNGVLRVFIPIGEQRSVQLSAFLLPNNERLFGIWRWLEERATPQDREALRGIVRQGRHWMLTPSRELVLVHATQQPVLTPQWVSLQVARRFPSAIVPQRAVAETVASLLGTIAIHRPSTEKIDLRGDWLEPIDEGLMKENLREWLYVTGKAGVFEVPVSTTPPAAGSYVTGRGLSAEPSEKGVEPESAFPGASVPFGNIPVDAYELPFLPEDAPTSDIQPRGGPAVGALVTPLFEAQPSVELKKLPPSALGLPPAPAAPPPPPPFDETKYRCTPTLPPPPPPDYGERLSFEGRHRLGDTKYRCVTYTAVATTRYREYFRPLPAEEASNPPRFTRSSAIKVDVLSSAQPDAPKVLHVLPTFKWEKTPQGSRRGGGGLRVYLDRPWYSSGDGEQLAVVLYPDATADLPESAKRYVTQWGLDPLWQEGPSAPFGGLERFKSEIKPLDPKILIPSGPPPGPVMPRGDAPLGATPQISALKQNDPKFIALFGIGRSLPTPADFRNAAVVRYDLGIKEMFVPLPMVGTRALPSGVQSATSIQPGIASLGHPMPVTICAFDVKPDPSRQLWYCDIEMNTASAYYPFIRLALARYQVNSIPGEHLSKVVLADFVQPVPDRSASIAFNPSNPNQATVSVTGIMAHAAAERTTVVEVSIEDQNADVPGDLGWGPVPNSTVALPRINAEQWSGQITVPPGPKLHRLVIKEYEVFNAQEPDGPVTNSPPPMLTRQQRRLVYADVVELRR